MRPRLPFDTVFNFSRAPVAIVREFRHNTTTTTSTTAVRVAHLGGCELTVGVKFLIIATKMNVRSIIRVRQATLDRSNRRGTSSVCK